MSEPKPANSTGDAPQQDLTIGELADIAGVSRRVIRFYVQRELIPPPRGKGRGSFYTELHLQRIRNIHKLQADGHSLDAIASMLDEPVQVEAANSTKSSTKSSMKSSATESKPAPAHVQRRAKARAQLNYYQADSDSLDSDPSNSTQSTSPSIDESTATEVVGTDPLWSRVDITSGIELNIDISQHQLDRRQLAKIKRAVTKIIQSK